MADDLTAPAAGPRWTWVIHAFSWERRGSAVDQSMTSVYEVRRDRDAENYRGRQDVKRVIVREIWSDGMSRTDPEFLSLRNLVKCWSVELRPFRGPDTGIRQVKLVWSDGRFAVGEIEAVMQAARDAFTDACDAECLWEKCHRTGIVCQLTPGNDDTVIETQ